MVFRFGVNNWGLQIPEFVKKLIEKKGRENVKMPYLIKKMLEKAGKLPKE
ncbi:ferrochelatase [Streptococcus pneumoniae]|nr:ferrochelatase [Streptococcus pneumoniae]VKT02823.1 ferrochelatase [Streptococcus pneumoniae]